MALVKELVKSNKTLFKVAKSFQPEKPFSKKYPVNLNFEITTVCDSKCTFCTHEEMIKTHARKQKNMDFEMIETIVEKFKELTKELPGEDISLNVTGLGEPLLHPKYFDALDLIRKEFPVSKILTNTNGICLDEKKATKLIHSPLDVLGISIRFLDRGTYWNESGVDKYEQVVANTKSFLREKGNRKPEAHVQVFDNQDFPAFIRYWKHFLNENDSIYINKYIDLVGWLHKERKKTRTKPCRQLWELIMVDIDGNVFPCCEGVWTVENKELILGNINDGKCLSMERLEKLRELHKKKNIGLIRACRNCPAI